MLQNLPQGISLDAVKYLLEINAVIIKGGNSISSHSSGTYLRAKMWTVHERPRQKPTCCCRSFGNGENSGASLARIYFSYRQYDDKSRLSCPGNRFVSCISLNMFVKSRGVSFSSALSISDETSSAPPTFPLLIAALKLRS